MSGHSHWATIKHKKGLEDAKKGKIFSKFAREITIAAKEGGTDLSSNSKLRMVIDRARAVNMPKENIERAIAKSAGSSELDNLKESVFEVIKDDAAIIIETITDNSNRALSEIKKVLNKEGGKLVAEGAIKWMFGKKSVFIIDLEQNKNFKKDDLEMISIDIGADDMSCDENDFYVYGNIQDFENIKKGLESKGVSIKSANLEWVAKESKEIPAESQESIKKLLEALEDLDDVQNVYTNAELS
ncbi:YebC/PmpR family DNA-binding transcriptional regulator [Candidatus Parcubacteria bacterium]|nr:YebC/PmpR family DNA-binding transcriptional regulator [Candidatus Parcubacteria bacterium]